MHVTLTVKREVNDHDGYCSCDECEYTSEILMLHVKMPEQYQLLPV
jgi:hypothetical protein